MKVELPKGIASISGTISRNRNGHMLVAKTYNRADGTRETRVYMMTQYQRTTPPSDKELHARQRFAQMAQEVTRRINNGDRRPRHIIWAEVKSQLTNHQ